MRSTVLAVAAAALVTTPALAASVPYDDPSVAGRLAFCDARGRLVTGGTLQDGPFAAKAVSDFVAPKPYDGPHAKVTLFGYQPRQGVDPGAWSGEALTSSSTFTDARHPSAEVTWGDVTLHQLVQDFPPHWDGLLQLRLYTGAPDAPVYRRQYAAADIRVTGGRWQVVSPVALPCTSGTATSAARLLVPDSVVSPAPNGGPSSRGASSVASRSAAPVAPTTGSSAPAAAANEAAQSHDGHRSATLPLLLLGAAAVAAGGWFLRSRLNIR